MFGEVLSPTPTLKAKLVVGVWITVSSCALFAYILALLERNNNALQEMELEESNVGMDTQLEIIDDEGYQQQEQQEQQGQKQQQQQDQNDGVKEQDDHARKGGAGDLRSKYRKLLPSQRIQIGLQVCVLTLMNYLLLVFLPGSGWLPFVGIASIWVMTLQTVIADEMRRQRLDRLLLLVTLFLLIAGGLTLSTYSSMALREGEIYQGPARIVGYDSSVYDNLDGETIRANLKVNWGGTWGCSATPTKFCTADVNGALCETKYDLSSSLSPQYNSVYNYQTQSPYIDDEYDSVLYKDKNEEVDVACDINGTEAVQVVYNDGNTTEFVDVYKEDGSDEIEVVYDKVKENSNGTENDVEEDVEVFEGGNDHGANATSNSTKGNNKNDNDGKNIRNRLLAANNTATEVEAEVEEKVEKDADVISAEFEEFEDEVYDEAVETVIDESIDVENKVDEDEISAEELEDNIAELQTEHDNLVKENADLQSQIDAAEKEDEDLIDEEINLSNNYQQSQIAENKNAKTKGGIESSLYTYDDTIFEDDYWQYEWDNAWGEYACEDLFNQDMNENDGYDPSTPPGGGGSSTAQQDWPTIQIYGNCNTCTAYIRDYYSTEHYNSMSNYQNQAQGYFMAASVVAVLAMFFYVRHVIAPANDNRTELLSSFGTHPRNMLHDGVIA